jgi:hypothetical protein
MFIVLNVMPDQKRAVFLSKCFRSMMLSLTTNVRPNVIKLRLAHRESRVSILPCKILQVRECFFKPMRRAAFQELDGLRYSKRCGDRKEQVNMICHTADFESVHSVFARNTTEIGE